MNRRPLGPGRMIMASWLASPVRVSSQNSIIVRGGPGQWAAVVTLLVTYTDSGHIGPARRKLSTLSACASVPTNRGIQFETARLARSRCSSWAALTCTDRRADRARKRRYAPGAADRGPVRRGAGRPEQQVIADATPQALRSSRGHVDTRPSGPSHLVLP